MTSSFDRHTIHRFDEELQALHFQIVEMGELVLNQLCLALDSLKNRDLAQAQGIINRERVVNDMEVSADTVICTVMVKRCPKGSDLRTVMAASKIVNNLERIGDEAAKLANFVAYLHLHGHGDANDFPLDDIYRLGGVSIGIVRSAVEVFERLDGGQARGVVEFHRTLDQQFQHGLHHLMDFLQAEKTNVSNAVSQVLMMKALERIGDHALRIAELVVFQLEGEEPRHRAPEMAQDFPLDE
jgi:phosphate transport system protein